jgi:hypothetical protein
MENIVTQYLNPLFLKNSIPTLLIAKLAPECYPIPQSLFLKNCSCNWRRTIKIQTLGRFNFKSLFLKNLLTLKKEMQKCIERVASSEREADSLRRKVMDEISTGELAPTDREDLWIS